MGYPPICNPPLYSAVTFEGDLLMEVDSIYVIELPMGFFYVVGLVGYTFYRYCFKFYLISKKVTLSVFFLMIFFFNVDQHRINTNSA